MNIEMTFSIGDIQLDRDNQEFLMALQLAEETNQSFYLTGKAGSGKTTFLKYLREVTNKQVVVLAPTGKAAINAGGQTIHSFFQIEPSLYVPNDKRLRTSVSVNDRDKSTIYDNFRYREEKLKMIRSLDLMIIDEVSMVRADLLDVVDTLLRVFRNNDSPFGGVQVILIGDVFQLSPIISRDEEEVFKKFYNGSFFFNARVMQRNECLLIIQLKKIYRQRDKLFIDLLNKGLTCISPWIKSFTPLVF